ncbi:MAG: NADH-quinone oxidoreductase subunit K [Elusimicrobiales bacterium]|jgi:NADH:ubiquinone oxidoreductase subunit K
MAASFSVDWYFITLIFFAGLYGMLVSRSLLRQFIGLEIMSKSCLLGIMSVGTKTGEPALAQALIITMIVIEVVVVAAGLALLVKNFRVSGSADVWALNNLKG